MRIFILFFILLAFISSACSENVNDAYIYATKFKKKVVRQEKVSPPSCPKCQDPKRESKPKVTPSLPKGLGCVKCQESKPKPLDKSLYNKLEGSGLSLNVLSGSTNQEKLFCNYSSYIFMDIFTNVDRKLLRENICPPIIVEFVLHKNGDITDIKLIRSGGNKLYDKNLLEAVSKVDLKKVQVTLPSNASNYAKARVMLRAYKCFGY